MVFMPVDKPEALAFILSGLTVVLFIIAIIVFIKYGGSAIFYIVVIIAFVTGFLNAWVISKMERPGGPSRMRNTPTRRRRSSRKRKR